MSGLSPTTLYHYRVKSKDAAGNLAVSPDAVFTTAPPPDTTPPAVSITTPAANSSVSGTITVSATATDNVSVVGVQFKLDNANLGAETTIPLYTFTWNTTTVANGTHTLTAVARDAAGNVAISAPVSVMAANGDVLPPSMPTGLTATAVSSSQIFLVWSGSYATHPLICEQLAHDIEALRPGPNTLLVALEKIYENEGVLQYPAPVRAK